jgi:hypothetical protein
MILNSSRFSYILGITSLIIAFCSAFFSVYGIAGLFSGATISVILMASSLEIGKLVATTFLYRYWTKTVGIIKIYLILAVIILTLITSAGIFGFLSSAYQKSAIDFKVTQEKIVTIEKSKDHYKNQIVSSDNRIKVLNESRKIQESRLSEALTNTFLIRNPIQLQQLQSQTIQLIEQSNSDIKTEVKKIEDHQDKLQSIDDNINNLKTSSLNKKDIQTFQYVANSLNTDLDTVVKWFIISLIFVFDPLALALIIAYNISIKKLQEPIVSKEPNTKLEETQLKPTEVPIDPSSEIVPIPVQTDVTPPAAIPQPKVEVSQGDEFFRAMFKR